MTNYRAWNAFVGEINRRPEFDGIREQLLEAGRKVILEGAPHPLSAPVSAPEPQTQGSPGAEAQMGSESFYYGRDGLMRCPRCHAEVYGFKEGYICSAKDCDWTEDHETEADR